MTEQPDPDDLANMPEAVGIGDLVRPVEYLTLEEVVAIAVELYGDPPPVRDLGLLGSAVARPSTTVFGQDAYPHLPTKAAALLHSLVGDHALVDGNKRLAGAATATLDINGSLPGELDEVAAFDLLIDVTTGLDDLDAIAARLEALFPVIDLT